MRDFKMLTLASDYDMGSTDVAIEYAIRSLNRQGIPVDQETIASIAHCSPFTVSRVISKWRKRKRLTVKGSPRRGYTYTFNE